MKKLLFNFSKTEIRNIIAVIYVVLVLLFIYVLAFKPVPAQNKDLINVLGGVVIGGVGTILSFFFGSSKNESDKQSNELLITKAEAAKPKDEIVISSSEAEKSKNT